ncbi:MULTISPECIES: wax ester/triacylglycerol synthase family O-acyltransferase [unclassified Pseudofrankia]|uniref:wax ester/triacylglycerol synthase family O-acyltransferase n=1 Tax=unclassified Pseudofrankia TaxID=2994372 RepID=UPI001F525FEA|nr:MULTISPECIES: wax ester/triacylglycerol synthase family O-acyltransferase [unclassified Pseudofrankia]MDT3441050.1 wax ester/triacylglycerol synthase family O-acyltransferase [Pseudofrankia sp. BMG5.37]
MLDFQRAYPTRPVSVSSYLLRLAGSPDLDQVRAAVLDRVRAFPALTERLVERRGRAPRWEPGGVIDVTRHVREYPLPAGATENDARAEAVRLSGVVTPLDGPAWEVGLLTSPGTGDVHIIFRASHVWVDGLSQNRVLTYLFGDEATAMAGPAWIRPGKLTPGMLVSAARRQAASWAGPSGGLAALTGPGGGRPSVGWASIGVDRLRAVGQAYGASVNDVYLVTVGGALAAWSSPVGQSPVRAVLSVSARRTAERSILGNAFVATRVALPLELASPAERFEQVRRQTAPYKGGSSASLGERFWSDRVPSRLGRRTIGGGQELRTAAVNTTNLGPIPGPLAVAGAPVITALPVPAVREGRRQVVITLGGLGRTVTAGFTVPAPGGEELAELWLAEIEGLERAAGIVPVMDEAVVTLAAGPAPR